MKQVLSKFPGKRALVADDYFVNQEVTQDILELMDVQVEIAENGAEAVQKYANGSFDVILMDIQMPELDGFQATKLIREAEAEGRRTPIIALTANALCGDREKCLAAGMDDYITKPIEAMKLEAILKKYLYE